MTGTVQKNKGKWYCVLYLHDENGKRKQKWISTKLDVKGNKKKAQARLNELLDEYDGHETITKFSDMLLGDYCDYWLKDKKESIDPSTYESYVYRIAHIKNYFNTRKTALSKVCPRDIKEFYLYLLKSGNRAKYKSNDGLSSRTIKDIATVLKAIFKDAVLMGEIIKDPTEKVQIPKKKQESKKEDIFIDVADLSILRGEIKGHILEELIEVTLFYGLRRSEVLGLKWGAINFDKEEVHINHTVVKIKERVEKDTTKTDASCRTYPLPDYIKDMLLKLKKEQEQNELLFGNEYCKNDYIFTWQDGRPLSPDYVTKTFKKIVTKSEYLPSELTFHDLRKSCVSMMVEDGCSVKEIQKWIGHAQAETTLNIYAKVKESKKKEIGNRMAEKFKQAI